MICKEKLIKRVQELDEKYKRSRCARKLCVKLMDDILHNRFDLTGYHDVDEFYSGEST